MTNILRVSLDERLFCSVPESSGEKVMLPPEQKPFKWVMVVCQNFSKARESLVKTRADMIATAKAFFAVVEAPLPFQDKRTNRCASWSYSRHLETFLLRRF